MRAWYLASVAKRAPVDAVTRAVGLLSARERSRAQLEAALRQRGYPDDEVAAAVARVAELGYLDDARVAAERARQGLTEGRSRQGVIARLVAQGVDERVAALAVQAGAEALGHDDEAAARALVEKRRVTGAKAARLLAARGFDEDLIARVVDQRD
jgi:regulatory protein